MSWGRRVVLVIAALAAGAALMVGAVYQRQIRSFLTHVVGPPEDTFELAPFPPDAAPESRLAAAGDVGDGGDRAWRTGATMYVAGRPDPYDALLLLGDNVYPDGDPALLDEFVHRPFAAVVDGGAELFAIAGNHDAFQPDGGLAQMRQLGMPGMWWSERIGDVLLVGLDSNQADNAEQRAWLGETLAQSDAGWKIVLVHEPPYSAGYQGSNREVRDTLSPLFAAHGVQLVLSGHEHDYQRSVPLDGVTYVISGGAAGTRRTGTEDYTAYAAATTHFVEVNVFADRLVVRAIDHHVRVIDEAVIHR